MSVFFYLFDVFGYFYCVNKSKCTIKDSVVRCLTRKSSRDGCCWAYLDFTASRRNHLLRLKLEPAVLAYVKLHGNILPLGIGYPDLIMYIRDRRNCWKKQVNWSTSWPVSKSAINAKHRTLSCPTYTTGWRLSWECFLSFLRNFRSVIVSGHVYSI